MKAVVGLLQSWGAFKVALRGARPIADLTKAAPHRTNSPGWAPGTWPTLPGLLRWCVSGDWQNWSCLRYFVTRAVELLTVTARLFTGPHFGRLFQQPRAQVWHCSTCRSHPAPGADVGCYKFKFVTCARRHLSLLSSLGGRRRWFDAAGSLAQVVHRALLPAANRIATFAQDPMPHGLWSRAGTGCGRCV